MVTMINSFQYREWCTNVVL